jgi:drug/metabolite transporter (DMT)-like permease
MKVGVAHLPPLTLNALRFLAAGTVLYAWCAWRRRRVPGAGWRAPTGAEWRAGAAQGLLLPAAGTGGATWAEQTLPSGTTALLLATIPLWMVLGRRVIDGERVGVRAGIGLAAGLAGVAMLADPFAAARPDPLATAVGLGGALCWGLGSAYAPHAPHPAQPLLAPAVEMLCAGAALAVLGGLAGEWPRAEPSRGAVLALAYLIVLGSIVAYSAYEWLLQHAPPRLTGTYAFVNPVVAVLLGWWLLGEPIGARTVAATLVISAGVGLIVTARRGERPDPPAPRERSPRGRGPAVPGPRRPHRR